MGWTSASKWPVNRRMHALAVGGWLYLSVNVGNLDSDSDPKPGPGESIHLLPDQVGFIASKMKVAMIWKDVMIWLIFLSAYWGAPWRSITCFYVGHRVVASRRVFSADPLQRRWRSVRRLMPTAFARPCRVFEVESYETFWGSPDMPETWLETLEQNQITDWTNT